MFKIIKLTILLMLKILDLIIDLIKHLINWLHSEHLKELEKQKFNNAWQQLSQDEKDEIIQDYNFKYIKQNFQKFNN